MLTQLKNKYNSLSVQVKASFWFLACTVIHRALTIITTPLFTRLLTTEEYGSYSVYNSWMGILSCFVTMNIYSGVYMQAAIKFDNEKKQYTSAMQGLCLSLSAVWFIVYLIFSNSVNNILGLSTSQMTSMFVVMWIQAVFGFWSAQQRIELQYKKLIAITILQTFLQPIICVMFIQTFSNKVDGVVWGVAVTNLICFVGLFIKHLVAGKVFFSRSIWTYTLILAVPLIPHYISSVVLNSADRIMIQQMVGRGKAGIYSVAYTISSCGVLVNQGLLQTLTPWIYKKIKDEKTNQIKRIAYPSLIIIGVTNILILLLAPELIAIFAPKSYAEAIWVMPPVVLSIYFKFMYSLFAAFEFYYEKTKYISFATAFGAVLNIVLNYIFINAFGYIAAGYTTLMCYIIFALMHYIFMSNIVKEKQIKTQVYSKRVLAFISGLYLCIGFSLVLTYKNSIIRYLIVLILILAIVIKRRYLIGLYKNTLKGA